MRKWTSIVRAAHATLAGIPSAELLERLIELSLYTEENLK